MQQRIGVGKRAQQLLLLVVTGLLFSCGGGGGGGTGLPASNVAPVANAGLPQNLTTGSVVTLDASKSTDGNADPLTYKWTLSSKPASSTAVLSSANAVKPTFTADLSGAYVFSLIVNDGKVDSSAVSVTINTSVSNVAPVANAGTAQSVITGSLVTLDGSTSSDANGDTLTYAWTISSKPLLSTTTLTGATTAKPTFTVDNSGSYVISLTVSDGRLNSTATTVTVTAATANVAPVANAGVAQNISTGAVVTLDGSASTDANGDSLVYTWSMTSKPSGSTAALSDTAAIKPTFTADKAGSYVAQLIVSDGKATSTAATVNITATTANAAPVANAGAAQNVMTGMSVTLNGSGSSDANGDTLTYAWALTSKPASSTAVLSSTTSVSPTFTADLAGTYVATLTVNDGKVSSAAATVAITASVANAAPVANAGSAQSVSTGATVTLNGSNSTDANGDTLTYLWSMTGKPANSAATLSSTTAAKPTFTADQAGTYAFTLTVNDGKVNSATASVAVTATVANIAPVANAGAAQSVATGALVTLNGSGSTDANGDTLSYVWTLTGKPTGSAAALSSTSIVNPTFTADLAGSYVASLVVNDGKVSSSNSATVSITVALPLVPLNDTGITSSGYDAAGNFVSTCAGAAADNDCNSGRDATANINSDGKAGFSFTKLDASGGVLAASATSWSCVKDNVTGLIWEVKTNDGGLRDWNKTYTNYDSTSLAQIKSYSTAVNPTQTQVDASTNSVSLKNAANAASLCGASDWRLPTRRELASIVDYSVASPGPTIDANWFPNTKSNFYWSSSAYAGGSIYAMNVYFDEGSVNYYDRSDLYAVRLVRAGQTLVQARYQYSSDGQEATDTQTGLVWRRCAEGMSWNGSTCTGTAAPYIHANALLRAKSEATASGKAWRLPNVKELESISDASRMNPSIDPTAFPATPLLGFWSSSAYASDSTRAWVVYFGSGYVFNGYRGNDAVVRLVRTGP